MDLLTQGGQIAVLAVHQEQIDGDLLAGALQRQALVEIGRRSQVLDVLGRSLVGIFSGKRIKCV